MTSSNKHTSQARQEGCVPALACPTPADVKNQLENQKSIGSIRKNTSVQDSDAKAIEYVIGGLSDGLEYIPDNVLARLREARISAVKRRDL
jgi:hypothetical protein